MPFEDDAVAAARTQASQAKLAAERAQRDAAERSKKEAAQALEQKRLKAEREAAVKAEQRRREDELRRKKLEEEKAAARKVREERERKLAEEKARGKAPVQRSRTSTPKVDQHSLNKVQGTRSGEAMTLTREEQRAQKQRAMWGEPSKKAKKKKPAPPVPGRTTVTPRAPAHASQAGVLGPRKAPGVKQEMLAIGGERQAYKSIEEVERERRAARASDDPARLREAHRRQAELETLERRRRAMEQKRTLDGKRKANHSDDSLFGSEDEGAQASKRPASPASKLTNQPKPSGPRAEERHTKDLRTDAPARALYKVNPAHFLPGAPAPAESASSAMRRPMKGLDVEGRKGKQKTTDKGLEGRSRPKSPLPENSTRLGRETAREKFLREEAERKARVRAGSTSTSAVDKRPKAGSSQRYAESESEDEEEDLDEYETEPSGSASDEDLGRHRKRSKRDDVRAQIWAALGMDRSKYESRDVYSDDDDMEADAASVYAEELRSARQAREEDRREEELERKRELAKAAKKRARERHG